jgi:hypothetical protein
VKLPDSGIEKELEVDQTLAMNPLSNTQTLGIQ